MKKKNCGTCRFFTSGDPSPKGIGNAGICTATLPRSKDFYARSDHVPFWAEQMVRRVIDFDGERCGVHVRRRGG